MSKNMENMSKDEFERYSDRLYREWMEAAENIARLIKNDKNISILVIGNFKDAFLHQIKNLLTFRGTVNSKSFTINDRECYRPEPTVQIINIYKEYPVVTLSGHYDFIYIGSDVNVIENLYNIAVITKQSLKVNGEVHIHQDVDYNIIDKLLDEVCEENKELKAETESLKKKLEQAETVAKSFMNDYMKKYKNADIADELMKAILSDICKARFWKLSYGDKLKLYHINPMLYMTILSSKVLSNQQIEEWEIYRILKLF